MGILQNILDRLDMCTQKTPVGNCAIVLKNPSDYEFDVN